MNYDLKVEELLSNQAKQYGSCFRIKKPIDIIFTDDINAAGLIEYTCRDKYIMKLNPQMMDMNNFDYYYLHEFYHCLQADEGYPVIKTGEYDNQYHLTSSILTSFVLDLNLDFYLSQNGFKMSHQIIEKDFMNKLKDLNDAIEKNEKLDSLLYVIYLSTFISKLYIQYDQNKAKYLINLSKKCSKYIWVFTQIFNGIIYANDYTNKSGCLSIFQQIYDKILVANDFAGQFCIGNYK